jgi:hypothetical protein
MGGQALEVRFKTIFRKNRENIAQVRVMLERSLLCLGAEKVVFAADSPAGDGRPRSKRGLSEATAGYGGHAG